MDIIFNRLEKVLNTGYSILMELEKDEPDMDKIEILYTERARLLSEAKFKWVELNENTSPPAPEKQALGKIKDLFMRLNLLEKNLNSNLKSLKLKKLNHLKQIDQLRGAKASYSNGNNYSQSSVSLFMDTKSGTY